MLAPKRNENPMQYWISLWPTAPLFGVPWRFEGMMPAATFFRPSDVVAQMTRASVRETAETVERAAQVLEKAAEVVEHTAEDVIETLDAVAPADAAEADAAEADAAATDEAATDEAGTDEARTVDVETAAGETVEAPALAAPATLYATAPAVVDDLKLIKGVGPKMEAMLNGMGIYRFDQIAGFSEANLAWVDENLTAFKGRPLRDDWVAQAKALL